MGYDFQNYSSIPYYKVSNDSYSQLQQNLSNQINQPKDLNDLKRNANLKYTQLQMARAQGDFDLASNLAYEHQRILQDIKNYYRN